MQRSQGSHRRCHRRTHSQTHSHRSSHSHRYHRHHSTDNDSHYDSDPEPQTSSHRGLNYSSSGKNPSRREHAHSVRIAAANLAASRPHPTHLHSQDEHHYVARSGHYSYIAVFSKGLPHDSETGILSDPEAYALFVHAVNTGTYRDIQAVPLGPKTESRRLFRSGMCRSPAVGVRAWESMAAGHTYDLEGPDAQAVTMPPAPHLESRELAFEMAELYWMSLTRDIPFALFSSDALVRLACSSLNRMSWIRYFRHPPARLTKPERARLRPPLDPDSLARGDTPGDLVGPYISQFLLVGTPGLDSVHGFEDGFIQYGGQRIDQRVRFASPGLDFMTTWEAWLDVQNGADVRGRETYVDDVYRFITTPRDLATFVHYDALYQAYLNACIILLALKAPFDKGLPFGGPDHVDKQQGFATFGGPHVLSLVTEVATRALKAVRFQKYNVHRRPRPEALGGLIERYHVDPDDEQFAPVQSLYDALDGELMRRIARHNGHLNDVVRDRGWPRYRDYDPSADESSETRLLPMAFPEGSPMHPSYGAGHATVAGACVTILKAFFDHEWELPFAFEASPDGTSLRPVDIDSPLTVAGELNKLCSNISIGRDWAGVHYYSDYRESIAMGEKVALGILEEQKLTYREKFTMTIPLFDGTERVI